MKTVVLFLLLLATQNTFATVSLPDDLFGVLPPPTSYLRHVNEAGTMFQKDLLDYLNGRCSTNSKFKECNIPNQIKRYEQLVTRLTNGKFGAQADKPTTKPWNLSAIASANFVFTPSAKGPSTGLDLVVDLFLTRQQILNYIDQVYASFLRVRNSTELHIYRAYWYSYIKSLSPLGAVNLVFSNMRSF